jgi:hypothetical protein
VSSELNLHPPSTHASNHSPGASPVVAHLLYRPPPASADLSGMAACARCNQKHVLLWWLACSQLKGRGVVPDRRARLGQSGMISMLSTRGPG